MSNTDLYRQTFNHIKLSDEQRNALLTLDTEKAPLKSTIKGKKQLHFWAAVAAVFLLIAMVPTVYAGVQHNWFPLFFNNSSEYDADLQGLAKYADTDETVTETDDFKLTIQGHLYSDEQQGGILICSLIFKNEKCYLPLNDVDVDSEIIAFYKDTDEERRMVDDTYEGTYATDEYVLEKDGTRAGMVEQLEGMDPICLEFYDSDGEQIKGWAKPCYKGELAEDGGYLIGIRYGERVDWTSNTMMVSDVEFGTPSNRAVKKVRYTVKALAKCRLPKAGKLPLVTYTNDEWDIILSPIGIYMKGFNVWDSDSKLAKAGVDESNLDQCTYLVLGDEDRIRMLRPRDISEDDCIKSYLSYRGASEDEWLTDYYAMFKSFIKIEDVNEININGVIFHKKKKGLSDLFK